MDQHALRKSGPAIGIFGSLIVAVVSVIIWNSHKSESEPPASRDFSKAVGKSDPKRALETYVEKYSSSSDKSTQDYVTSARLRLGFATAKQKDYKRARTIFLAAEKEHKGDPTGSPTWGSLPDQAAYQAAVCLMADGRKEEAREEFRKLIKERQESPIIYACMRRLKLLNGGVPTEADVEIMNAAVAKRDVKIARDIASCGPQALDCFLRKIGVTPPSADSLTKLCGTNGEGTSMANMHRALTSLGIETKGIEVNSKDFPNVATPALWLRNTHFVVLTHFYAGRAHIFDPLDRKDYAIDLPTTDDKQFSAFILERTPGTQG